MHHSAHTNPDALVWYAFVWSEARLVIAALALFLGGYPPILYLVPVSGLYGILSTVLKVAWLISGCAALYLVYRWQQAGQKLFGQNNSVDRVAFFVMSISGINLGFVGLIGTNIGMSISSSYALFLLTALTYLVSAYHLYTRWMSKGQKFL